MPSEHSPGLDKATAGLRQSALGRGIVCMVAGSALLASNDAAVKWLTDGLPVGQIMALRGLFLVAALLAFFAATGRLVLLRANNWPGQALRGGLVLVTSYLFFTALSLMPLADAIAIGFAGPLFLTVLAVPLLGERVGWRRCSAVVVGFLGVLLVAQPGGGGLGWAALLPLAAAFLAAFRDICTRRLSAHDASLTILFYTTAAVAAGGLATIPFGWQPLGSLEVGLLLLSSLLVGCAHFLQIEAFRYAEASAVAPYRYSALVWAVLLGFLIWGSLPNLLGWLGAGLITASGLYIWHRERKRRDR